MLCDEKKDSNLNLLAIEKFIQNLNNSNDLKKKLKNYKLI